MGFMLLSSQICTRHPGNTRCQLSMQRCTRAGRAPPPNHDVWITRGIRCRLSSAAAAHFLQIPPSCGLAPGTHGLSCAGPAKCAITGVGAKPVDKDEFHWLPTRLILPLQVML